LSKSPLTAKAEAAFFDKLKSTKDATDRWLPDAFATVLTANDGKLMKKLLAVKSDKNTSEIGTPVNHDHQNMMTPKAAKKSDLANGVDLVIDRIEVNPVNPAVRERINVIVHVKNQGKEDLKPEVFVPLNIRFSGNEILVDQVSRNYKEGIRSGETVAITKNINGPWVGNIAFYTDQAGDYNLEVNIDDANELNESDKLNNKKSQKITFSPPPSMTVYALERAIRSYSSLGKTDELISIIKTVQQSNAQGKASAYKAIAEGWNYKSKDVKIAGSDAAFLAKLAQDKNLQKVLKAWNVLKEETLDPNRKVVKISAIREAMKYDVTSFTVKAGQAVEVVFSNPDAMQHNIVFVQPNAMEKVGTAADKMMMDNKGAEKNYVPALPQVLFASSLVNPDQTFTLNFKAPSKPGKYPFVCTFPGHWRLMNGVMIVE
jgi:azurin